MTTKNSQKSQHLTMPVSVRLTADERAELMAAASGQSLSTYIRARLFDVSNTGADCSPRLSPQTRQRLLAQILLRLGQSDLTAKLTELSEAARLGVLDFSPEVQSVLADLTYEIRELRLDLIKALGLRPGKDGET